MCELAVEYTSTWLMVDAWEARQEEYQRTAVVLEHFNEEINRDGGVELQGGGRKRVQIMLLAGGDLIESFGHPGVWAEEDVRLRSFLRVRRFTDSDIAASHPWQVRLYHRRTNWFRRMGLLALA